MRIVLWHGYLLGGTGSNVYSRQLAREWSRAGHEVVVLSQEARPERYDLGGAATRRPDVGGFLPVFVLDRYEGFDDVRRLPDCSRAELERWVEANAAAIRVELPADLVFTNHVLLGGPVGAAAGAPFAVKAHGSELEYAMRGDPALSAWGAECLAAARATFVGSEHIRRVLQEVCGRVDRVHEVPPGVDVDEWVPERREDALRSLVREAAADPPNPGNGDERLPDEGNEARLGDFLTSGPVVVYFGKLIPQKGVDVLLDALSGVDARVVIVGFGPERASLEERAAALGVRALFTGPLEHRHLRHLLALADACVVPSVFPEAFGMVAAEAAAAGCPPVMSRHSGLAEVAAGLEAELPPSLRPLVSFPTGDVGALHERLVQVLALAPADRETLRTGVRTAVVDRWSWAGVARRLLELSR